MLHISIPIENSCEFLNVTKINPLISKCQIKVCYINDNRNGTVITRETAKELGESLRGSPIVGYFAKEKVDFEEHRQIEITDDGEILVKDNTIPYGFVDLEAKVWFQQFIDDNEIIREYLCTEGWLWTGQMPEAQRIIDKGNNQSMELDRVKGYWSNDDNFYSDFFIINEAIIKKLCILGEDVEPCFEGATIKEAPDFTFSFNKQIEAMQEQLNQILNKEDSETMGEESVVITEEVQTEEAVIENEPEVVDQNNEIINNENQDTIVEEPQPAYSLNEIPEYVELLNNYNALIIDYNNLKAENADLQSFKNTELIKQKNALIDSFYMLSDEDKKEVKENIEKYSLDEIEAKLSIICVRNKVSFSLKEEEEVPTVYNIQNNENDFDTTPAWIKAVAEVAKTL